jgi:hypothetical protein
MISINYCKHYAFQQLCRKHNPIVSKKTEFCKVFDPLLTFGDTDTSIPFLDKTKQDSFRLLARQFSTDLKGDSIRDYPPSIKTLSQINSRQKFYKKQSHILNGI